MEIVSPIHPGGNVAAEYSPVRCLPSTAYQSWLTGPTGNYSSVAFKGETLPDLSQLY